MLIALAAPFLGGSHRPWAWGALSIGLGVLLALFPPKRPPGGWLGWLMPLLLLGLCAAFLPRTAQPLPRWRATAEQVFGIQTGGMVSPQPWLTLDCIVLFGLALVWVCLLLDPPWKPERRHAVQRVFVAGLLVIAGISLAGYFAKGSLPFWENDRFLGPFPNRNQMAALLAMAALLTFPPLVEDIRRKNPRVLFWLLCLGVFLSALVLNYSRAGLLMVAAGGFLWAVLLSAVRKSHLPFTVAVSTALLLGALFLFLGGETLKRFIGISPQELGSLALLGFRLDIYKDTLRMIADQPLFGVGLGNFEPVFQFYREASARPLRLIHPESDWLWAAAEAGVPWTVLFAAGLALFVLRAFPLDRSRHLGFRLMAVSAAAAFALHGLIDVSGHRLGSVFPALFVFSLAVDPVRGSRRESGLYALGMRILGLIFVAGGYVHWSPGLPTPPAPGFGQWLAYRESADKALAAGQFPRAFQTAERALAVAPLDWRLYFQRASAAAHLRKPWWEIAEDFRRARALERSDHKIPLAEAKFWAATGRPLLAGAAWREAARRSPAPLRRRDIEMVIESVAGSPELRSIFRELAGDDRDQLLEFLQMGTPEEFQELLGKWLAEDPELSGWPPEDKRRLFALWWRLGDRPAMIRAVMPRPDWLSQCWETLAEFSIERNDPRSAFMLAERFVPKPSLPPVDVKSSLSQLERTYGLNKGSLLSSYSFYERLRLAGRAEDAFTVAGSMAAYPGAPAYWHYLLAKELAERGRWGEAWSAMRHYNDLRSQAPTP